MIRGDDGEDVFLLPLKKKRHEREQTTENRRGQSRATMSEHDAAMYQQPGALNNYGRSGRFEDSLEWRWTKPTCTGLFRVLGRYYDEMWFPTVIKEWCLLYYQSNHTAHYWQYRDEWLAGDEEVRMAVWYQILRHRSAFDRKRSTRRQYLIDTNQWDASRQAELLDEEEAAKVVEMQLRGAVKEASELLDLKKEDVCEDAADEADTSADRALAETEAAELALADPDDQPDWVDMRRRMRGSFAALNLARLEVDAQLLDHVMIELCKYWANAPPIEHCVDQLLERNIVREVQKFRFKLFGVAVETEPTPRRRSPEPAPRRRSREPTPRRRSPEPEPKSAPKPKSEPQPRTTVRRKPSTIRAPGTTKLAEARAARARQR